MDGETINLRVNRTVSIKQVASLGESGEYALANMDISPIVPKVMVKMTLKQTAGSSMRMLSLRRPEF